jgi:hypothetical protein
MNISIAGAHEVDTVWPLVAPKFMEASERCGDDFSSGEMWQMCRSGNAFLLVASDDEIRAAMVARFERWTDGPVLRVLCIGGHDIRLWLTDGADFLKKFMVLGEARRVVFDGRDGWQRVLKVRKLRSVYEMEID